MKTISSSIRTKMMLFIGLSLLLIMLILGAITLSQLNTLQTKDSENLRNELLIKEKEGLQNATHVMAQVLSQSVAEWRALALPEEEIRQRLAQENREIGFGDLGYFFIYDTSGNTISLPPDPALEGTNRWDLQDSEGTYLLREFVNLAGSGGGFLDYVYENPSTKEKEGKISYAEMIEGTDYLIGSGTYESVVNETVERAIKDVTAIKNHTKRLLLIVFFACLVTMVAFIYMIATRITKPLRELTMIMAKAKEGDLTVRSSVVQTEGGDEVHRISVSFNQMIAGFGEMISRIGEMTQQLAAASEELYASGEQVGETAEKVGMAVGNVASGAEEQSAQIEEVSRNVSTLTDRIKLVGDRSATMMQFSMDVTSNIQQGNFAVDQSIVEIHQIEHQTTEVAEVIKSLGSRSEQVGSIVELINGIASQTNLLALNAAIEAARAGEAGRGFSVVADQIRKLAEESANATEKISLLIKGIQNDIQQSVTKMDDSKASVTNGVESMNRTVQIFRQIQNTSASFKDHLQTIAVDTKEMAHYSEDVKRAAHDIAQVSQKFAGISQDVAASNEEQIASTQEIISSSKQISEMAEELAQAIERFKI